MKIELAGHHIDITDKIRESIDSRFSKIASHFPDIDHLNVTLTNDSSEMVVEADTQYRGAPVAVRASDRELNIAIRDAEKKLEAALTHRKGAVSGKGGDRVGQRLA